MNRVRQSLTLLIVWVCVRVHVFSNDGLFWQTEKMKYFLSRTTAAARNPWANTEAGKTFSQAQTPEM